MQRVVIVGAGKRAAGIWSHLEAANFAVEAVVEPDAARRAAAGERLGADRVYVSLDDLFRAGVPLECAVVVTPPWLHADAFVACVQRGLHVFCEKPMDMDLAAADRMRRAAREAGVRTMFGFNRRYTPVGRLARALRGAEAPYFVHTSKSRPMTYSRMLAENAVHAVDLLLCLAASAPVRVQATGRFKAEAIEAEAFVTAALAFASGAGGSLQMVTDGAGSVERLEVYGPGYTLRGDLGGWIRYAGEPERLQAAAAAAGVTLQDAGQGLLRVAGEADVLAELKAFTRAIAGEVEDIPDAEQAFAAQWVVEAIYREAGLSPTRWSERWVRES